MKILVLNSGSSSQKACLYEIGASLPEHPPACLWEAQAEFGSDAVSVTIKNSQGVVQEERIHCTAREHILSYMLSTLSVGPEKVLAHPSEIDVVGHRVVHGGPHFEEPVAITPEVRAAISDVTELAPLHTPAAIEGMDVIQKQLGDVPQVAVFDTGFHRQMPAAAAIYPGPYEWMESGIRRYGFHGINHQYCNGRAAQLLKRDPKSLKVVSCHIGNGCSVTAIDHGRSVDTTMGFTPLDGLMMGTRSGAVDPGILIYLMSQCGISATQLDHMLNQESGLLGISGISSDMREIFAAMQQGHQRATLAFDIFVHRLRSAVGSMAAVLGEVDALIFTAGIGEHSSEVRAAACSTLAFLGIKIDAELNARPKLDADISAPDSRVRVLVIRAEEDWAIATQCWKLMSVGSLVSTPD